MECYRLVHEWQSLGGVVMGTIDDDKSLVVSCCFTNYLERKEDNFIHSPSAAAGISPSLLLMAIHALKKQKYIPLIL